MRVQTPQTYINRFVTPSRRAVSARMSHHRPQLLLIYAHLRAAQIVHRLRDPPTEQSMQLRTITVCLGLVACAEPPTLTTREQDVVAPPELDAWIAEHQIPLSTVEAGHGLSHPPTPPPH